MNEVIDCRFEGQPFTVGEKKVFTCDVPNITAQSKIEFIAPPNFEVQPLGSVIVQGTSVSQNFTSYKVGGHSLGLLKIKIDEKEFAVSPSNFEVKSIISGSPTPYPIVTPESVPVPLWWWGVWIVAFLIIFVASYLEYLKYKKKKALEAQKLVEVNLSPLEKFQAKMRKLESKGLHNRGEYKHFALELTNIIKKTIGEELAFAAEDLTSEELLSTLERRHKVYFNTAGKTIESFLSDLDQIKFAKIETDAQKCNDLLDRGSRIGNALFGRLT